MVRETRSHGETGAQAGRNPQALLNPQPGIGGLATRSEKICPWVFHRNGRRVKNFRKAWEHACEAAGVPGRIPHDLRRTAVRNLERAGVSRSVAMQLTGHKTESVYRRYAIVSESDLGAGLEKARSARRGDNCGDKIRKGQGSPFQERAKC